MRSVEDGGRQYFNKLSVNNKSRVHLQVGIGNRRSRVSDSVFQGNNLQPGLYFFFGM
jgi:hypothetical protein